MANREIKIIFKGDSKDAEAAVKRINAEIAKMSNGKAQMPAGFDKARLDEYRRVSDQLRKIELANAKEQARQVTETKKSELRQFENAEKSKQRIAEISSKGQIAAANNAAKAEENARRREYQEYVRLEKEKTKAAQAEAKRREAGSFTNRLKGAGDGLSSAGTALSLAVTAPVLGLATIATKGAAEFDSLKRGLTAVAGSADEAEKQIVRLREVAKLPGLGFKEAIQGSINLQAAGLSADQAEKALKAFGNALATVGKGKAELDGVNLALSQIQSKGKVSAEEINQLNERVPQIRQAMKDAFGTADTEVLQKRGIGSSEFIDKITAELAKLPQVTGGAQNAFENLGDTVEQALLPLGNAILPNVVAVIDRVTPIIQQVSDAFANLSPETQQFILVIAGIAAAVGPALVVIAQLISAITVIGEASAFAPIIAAVAAVGLAITAFVLAYQTNFGGIKDFTAEVVTGVQTVWNDLVSFFTEGEGASWITSVTQSFEQLKTDALPVLEEVSNSMKELLGGVVAWVKENYPLIKETIQTVFKNIEKVVKPILEAIAGFWRENGEEIKTIVGSYWEIFKTIIGKGMEQIGNVIKLAMQLINSDTEGAAETLKKIWDTAINGVKAIIEKAGQLWFAAMKLAIKTAFNVNAFVVEEVAKIGQNIGEGLANGIRSKASGAYDAAKDVAGGVINWFRTIPQVQSPSKVTTEIGGYVSEGFAKGITEKGEVAKSAAKKVADETLKQFRDAATEFNKIAGMSPDSVNRSLQADEYTQGASDLQEIIKLRGKTATNLDQALPTTLAGTTAELARLKEILKQTEDRQTSFEKNLESLKNVSDEMTESIRKNAEEFEKRKQAIEESGTDNVLNLSKEIDLLGVTSDIERQRIENLYKIKKLRADMAKDGFSEDQIKEAENLQRAENARALELVKLREDKQAQIDAAKELADAQKEAAEEAAQSMRETWQTTYDFISESLDILTDKNLSFGEKIKSFFGNIKDRLQESFLDKLSGTLTTQILGFDPNEKNSVVGAVNKSNDYLKIITTALTGSQTLFGGGSISPITGTGGAGLLGTLGSIITGGNLNNRSGINSPMIMNYGGSFSNLSLIPDLLGGMSSGVGNGRETGGGSIFSNLKNLFSTNDGGLFAKRNNILTGNPSRLGGMMGGIGDIASFIAPLLGGGRLSSVVGMAGQGASLGSMFGPWGAAAGAVIGGAIGLFSNPQRRNDETTRDALMVQTLQQLNEIKSGLDRRPPSIDSNTALSQASQIQANYFSVANSLKDKKTRGIAVKDGNERVTPLVAAISASSRAALQWQVDEENRSRTAQNFIGEFAHGGYIQARNGGHLAVVGEGGYDEYILSTDPKYRARTMGLLSSFAEKVSINIPKHASGGVSFDNFKMPSFSSAPTNVYNVTVNVEKGSTLTKEEIRDEVLNGLQSAQGKGIVKGHIKATFNGKS